jgi:hypothetical protein
VILSHKHRFVFIKGVKVAGTSVEIALSQICGPDDIITPITPVDEKYRLGTPGEPRNYSTDRATEAEYLRQVTTTPADELATLGHPKSPFTNHMSFGEVLKLAPGAEQYRLIFVERSPYAKVLSFANWQQHQQAYRGGQSLAQSQENIAAAVDRVIADGQLANVRNIERYRDLDGALRAAPWKLAYLEQSLRAFFAERGVEPVAFVHAKKGLGSDSIDPASVLRPDQIALINETFADEFEAFGFPMVVPTAQAMNF